MSPGSSTESYPAFARIGLRENPGKDLNQGIVRLRMCEPRWQSVVEPHLAGKLLHLGVVAQHTVATYPEITADLAAVRTRLPVHIKKIHLPKSLARSILHESPFSVFGQAGQVMVWRKVKEDMKIDNLQPTVKHGGGGKVMVWGCMSAAGVGELIFIDASFTIFLSIREVVTSRSPFRKTVKKINLTYISFNTTRCRHPGCNEPETLGHVLGFYRKTQLLRNNRHHKARTGIADVLKCRGWEFSRKMTERIEQRYCIKFYQKLGDSQSQTIRKIQQVFGEDAMGVTQIKEWFNRFKDGRTSAESEQRCGRPQTARSAAVVERVRNLVMADRRLTVREIAEEVGVSKDSAHAIFRDDLNMNRVAAKFVPTLLSPEQKDLRRDVAQDLLDTANTDPGFLNTVITGDESWVYGYDPETKRQSSQWKHPESPRPKKARQVRSKIKVMLTVFFDVRGIVHHEYAPEGQTVIKEYYHDVLRRLRDAVRRKRPDMWTANNWHLHHDNAPAHSSQLIHIFLAKHGITMFANLPTLQTWLLATSGCFQN
ncbi:hypothetical protein ANN_15286 [Periplaneta americana]|uniref:Mos1 transposase HTH domain-containing protein n=1 Tax=Periplaneta americana TaxID=6978 RepID=A0ABQ8SG02_PERAM|nr:hypothetical protein ANN_15286 [Periplaneta americana]